MVRVAGIAVHVMPCHDCGIYSQHLCIVYHDACETIFCMLYNAVFMFAMECASKLHKCGCSSFDVETINNEFRI